MLKDEVCSYLIDHNITFASAESLTGGLFASTVTSVSGISKVYKGSIISYASSIKRDILGIPQEDIDKYGVVSYQVGYLMSKSASKLLDVDLAVSFTGNAGPQAMEGKEVGLVYIGITYLNETKCFEFHFQGNRQEIREQCVDKAFTLIKEIVS
ncbi:MAG: CinA family protein [Bacilli bacterium]